MDETALTRTLSRGFKRLQYWMSELSGGSVAAESAAEVEALLNTYALLMVKLARPLPPEEQNEALARFADTERKLNSIFEAKRLFPSELNPRLRRAS